MSTSRPPTTRRRLGREDWEHAALAAMAEGGLAAAGVEPLARRLGVTKGSFYWHFSDHAELMARALVRWDARDADALAALTATAGDAKQMLVELATSVLSDQAARRLEHAIAAAQDPAVVMILDRVRQRREAAVAELLVLVGLDGATAERRALVAEAALDGMATLVARRGADARALACDWAAMLCGGG